MNLVHLLSILLGLSLVDGQFCLRCNIRIPVHTPIETIKKTFQQAIHTTSLSCQFPHENKALYFPKDHFLVQTLCNIYNTSTSSCLSPIAIGGATYARAFPNCISFGANMPGAKDMCHQTDEFIKIDDLLLTSKIYARAIDTLAKE